MLSELFEEYFGWIAGILIISLITGMIVAVYVIGENHKRLIDQCIADGKKEYECEALLKQDVVPVIIPIPSGR